MKENRFRTTGKNKKNGNNIDETTKPAKAQLKDRFLYQFFEHKLLLLVIGFALTTVLGFLIQDSIQQTAARLKNYAERRYEASTAVLTAASDLLAEIENLDDSITHDNFTVTEETARAKAEIIARINTRSTALDRSLIELEMKYAYFARHARGFDYDGIAALRDRIELLLASAEHMSAKNISVKDLRYYYAELAGSRDEIVESVQSIYSSLNE